MANVKIEGILAEIEKRIHDIKTPEVRARALLDYLSEKQNGINLRDLISKAGDGINETLDIMYNWEMIEELNIAIKQVTNYLEKGSYLPGRRGARRIPYFNDLILRLNGIVNRD
jgi:hypothetical protein